MIYFKDTTFCSAAAKNLVAQKGRHNTEIAYKRLEEAVKKGE